MKLQRRVEHPTIRMLPSLGSWHAGLGVWRIEIEGWVHTRRSGSLRRDLASRVLREIARLPKDDAISAVLRDRLRDFAVRNLSGVRVEVEILGHRVMMPPSGSDGRFVGHVDLEARHWVEPHRVTRPTWLDVRVIPSSPDFPGSAGQVQILPSPGVIVVCDIDDTIKISDVADKRQLLANTFALPYRAVPGMPDALRRWSQAGAAFAYVSNSPVPLLGPLCDFMTRTGFPRGILHLREFAFRERKFMKLFDSVGHKRSSLNRLASGFCEQDLVLVGDTVEHDANTYAELAVRHPGRVRAVVLRRHPARDLDDTRRRELRERLGPVPLYCFEHARELPETLPVAVAGPVSGADSED